MKQHMHGGDITAFGHAHPNAPRPLIDLSTGINPMAYPASFDGEAMRRLPGTEDYKACAAAFASYAQVAQKYVNVMPGSQAAISILPTLVEPCDVAILAPTYSEHERNWTLFGHRVALRSCDEILHTEADIIVLAHPNNPDGHLFDHDSLQMLQERQAARAGWLIVDEAFVDTMPEVSVASQVQHGGLIVLRSFGKFFGLAGCRLGFVLAPEIVGARLAERLGPWSVNTVALKIAAEAYENTAWINATRKHLLVASKKLRSLLVGAGLKSNGGTPLFQLAMCTEAERLATHLASRGIYVRSFAREPNWMRFGVPGAEEEWARLSGALDELGEMP